jgi:hypothetical protein
MRTYKQLPIDIDVQHLREASQAYQGMADSP